MAEAVTPKPKSKPKPAPLPIFHPGGLKPALVFRQRMGELGKRLRKAPRAEPSRAPEIDYIRRSNIVLRDLSQLVLELVIPKLPAIIGDAPLELRRRVDVGEVLEETIGKLRIAFAVRAPLEQIARRAGNDAERRAGKDQKRIVAAVLGIQPELAEPWLGPVIDQFAKSNAKLVGSVTEDFIDRLDRRISDRMREGLRPEEIAKEIERDFVSSQGIEAKRARNRAKLIARDQTATLQGDVTRIRQQQLGIRRYVWRTAKDERVRSSHKAREGETFVWGKPIGPQLRKKGLKVDTIDGPPGRPINCRCYAEPLLSDVVEDLPEI